MIRISTAMRNWLDQHGPWQGAFEGGVLELWSGAQPASADSPMVGVKRCELTLSAGARTNEVRACGSVTLTNGGTGDTITSITVNSVEILGRTISYATSLAATAELIAAQINAYQSVPKYSASVSGAKVIIKAGPRTGTGPNGYVVASIVTGTMTRTNVNMGTEVTGVAQANGLTFGPCVAGKMSKSVDAWEGTVIEGGQVQSFRFCSTEADDNSTSTTLLRLTGSVSTSGADLNLSNTTLTTGAKHTQAQFDITVPAYKS